MGKKLWTTQQEFVQLEEGDTFYVDGVKHVVGSELCESDDFPYDLYLYDTEDEDFFRSDFPDEENPYDIRNKFQWWMSERNYKRMQGLRGSKDEDYCLGVCQYGAFHFEFAVNEGVACVLPYQNGIDTGYCDRDADPKYALMLPGNLKIPSRKLSFQEWKQAFERNAMRYIKTNPQPA